MIAAAVACALLLVAGLVLLALPGATTAAGVGAIVCLGLGGIGAVALAFYVVGRSEDEERAREERRRGSR